MVEYGASKALFDPFFHSHFDTYSLVPSEIREKIFAKEKPFDKVNAIFVSHAHGDHFSDTDTLKYLSANPNVALIAPQQAIDMMKKHAEFSQLKNSMIALDLAFKDPAKNFQVLNFEVEAVRIPHAGWPARADIHNMVYRVSANNATVMHMGDADPNKDHYLKHQAVWNEKITQLAFPPYWFYFSQEGNEILDKILNIEKSIGIHVPVKVPTGLNDSGKDYFSIPGEARIIKNSVQ